MQVKTETLFVFIIRLTEMRNLDTLCQGEWRNRLFCTVSWSGNRCIMLWRVVWGHLLNLFDPRKYTVGNLPGRILAKDVY